MCEGNNVRGQPGVNSALSDGKATKGRLLQAGQVIQQCLGMNGLGENVEAMPFCFGAFKKVGCGGLPGQQDDLAGRLKLRDANGHIDSTDAAEDYVANQHV